MPADTDAANTVSPAVKDRSVAPGDVPEALRRRYFLDERGGPGLAFYVDATVKAPAFRDRGGRLVTARTDPNAIRDMMVIARHRQWSIVTVRGAADFRRETWLAGRSLGIEVRGYRPTDRDMQELERRLAPTKLTEQEPHSRSAATLRIVETVVRSRVAERSAQERILTATRERLARWLEQGAHVRPISFPGRDNIGLRQSQERHPRR